jgi:glycosyltransferase involved in cell wall biosynthesis
MKNTIGIYPWVNLKEEGDKHQALFADALESNGFNVKRIPYKKGFPLKTALKYNVDVLILDWVHSFYTSQQLFTTLIKSILGLLELQFLNKGKTTIIWNLHNLQRHDGMFKGIEKFCFKQLAKKVDYIRVFDKSHIDKVSKYLEVSSEKIVAINQGPYIYEENIEIDLYERYEIPKDKNILLFFGSIREGKGIVNFLNSFANCKVENWVLLIAGKAFNEELRLNVEEVCKSNPNIYFSNIFIPDREVKSYFEGVNAIVLPYEKTLNSGVLLLAKSYGTKVLARENFKDLVQKSDIIGNLFDPNELNKLLVNAKQIDRTSIKPLPNQWSTIIADFKKIF